MKKIGLLLSFAWQDARYKLVVRSLPPLLFALHYPVFLLNRRLSLKMLLASHRANQNRAAAVVIRRKLDAIARLIGPAPGLPSERELAHILGRSLVLKRPVLCGGGVVEKGILLIKFTETFAFFLRHVDCAELLENYHVVLEPSWTGQALEEVLGWTRYRRHKVYVQTADRADFEFIAGLGSNLQAIHCGASDYVDHRIFRPLGNSKEFDSVCIANYTDHKRLHAYVKAVHRVVQLRPAFRAALVCAAWGRRRAQILDLINCLGLRNNFRVFEGLKQEELSRIVDKSYVSVLMSWREGANKTLFESLFTDVPAIVLQENLGVNKAHFTKETGLVVPERELPQALLGIRRHYGRFAPRKWAMAHISPEATLSKVVKAICDTERAGEPFTSPVFTKVNVPEARYMYDYPEISPEESRELVAGFVRRQQPSEAPAQADALVDESDVGETLA